jgi:transcriptional regulator with XRE-family HTH domain
MNTDQEIGQRVGMLMANAGMTQGAMAQRMGITQAAISRKLSGERPWFADELALAARILGVSVGELFGERHKPRRVGSGAAGVTRPRVAKVAQLSFSG